MTSGRSLEHSQHVVGEVEGFEAIGLSEKGYQSATRPVDSFAEVLPVFEISSHYFDGKHEVTFLD